MATQAAEARETVTLTDQALFREACYIDGQWITAGNGATIAVDNPATGRVVATVPKLGTSETRQAIEAANRAWPAWRALTAKQRGGILRQWDELVMEHQEKLGRRMTHEQGKALPPTRRGVGYPPGIPEGVRGKA